jgi:hypothetical protein
MRKPLLAGVAGFLTAWLLLGTARYLLAAEPEPPAHFHANFGMMLRDQTVDFSGDAYMEDVGACSADGKLRPQDRTHLHNNDGDTVHVHAEGVTWGHFLANLGYAVGDGLLQTDDGTVYRNTDTEQLQFLLNDALVDDIANRPIRSEDALFIYYGVPLSADLLHEASHDALEHDAHEHNVLPDPGSCSGRSEETTWDKLKRSFWV